VDLVCDIHISDVSNGMPPRPYTSIGRDLEANTFAIADRLVEGNSFKMGLPFETRPDVGDVVRPDNERAPVNQAALADMSWIVTPILYTTTEPDAVESLTVQVNQGMVGRGVFPFWAEFTVMNDPDYWLDTFTAPDPPEVGLIFLGGCLLDTSLLTFGDGQLNSQAVFNTGRLATYYDPPGEVMGFEIDGVAGVLFQGNYVMGVSERRIALSNRSWLEGSTDAEAWVSWLPDLYMGDCKPAVLPAQTLEPASSNFGASYSPIRANKVIKNAIDSVQNFDQGGGTWWWDDWVAPYDNDSTMGLAMHSTHVGVYQYLQPDPILQHLNNATVEIIEFRNRNNRPLPGWKLGNYLDFDFRTSAAYVDTTKYDPSISLGWGYCKTGATAVGGLVKLPFTPFCAVDSPNYLPPMKNCIAIDQRQGMWGAATHSVPYLDSAYYYMSLAPGSYGHNPLPADEDMAASFTLAEHDFEPLETYTVAVGYFEFQGYPTPTTSAGAMTALAHQLNKFMGYSRGDMNNDNKIDLADVIYLANRISYGGPGAYPYEYLANVNCNTTAPYYTIDDVMYLAAYYFQGGPCPDGILKNTAKSIVE
jgi:hypothetical protein